MTDLPPREDCQDERPKPHTLALPLSRLERPLPDWIDHRDKNLSAIALAHVNLAIEPLQKRWGRIEEVQEMVTLQIGTYASDGCGIVSTVKVPIGRVLDMLALSYLDILHAKDLAR